MSRYLIFEKTVLTMQQDDFNHRHYAAIPESQTKNGIFIASSHPELSSEALTVVEAKTPEAAVATYEQTIKDGFY